jgi:hypothetical protein
MLEIAFDVEGWMFLLKQMEDLEALINCPDHLRCLSKQDLMLLASVTVAFQITSKIKDWLLKRSKFGFWGCQKVKPLKLSFFYFCFSSKKIDAILIFQIKKILT